MKPRVLRYPTHEALVDAAADRLLNRLIDLQAAQGLVNLCLTGGRVANEIYEKFAERSEGSALDSTKLALWWGDERFVETSNPDRNALQSLAILARHLQVVPSQTHIMPPKDGQADPDEAAFDYAEELGDTVFDLCLLGMGPDGHVASIFPKHPSSDPTSLLAIGVTDSPKPPAERISLTFNVLNRSEAIWLFVTGSEKANAAARSLAGDRSLPATHVEGTDETLWFMDADAAALVPTYHCPL